MYYNTYVPEAIRKVWWNKEFMVFQYLHSTNDGVCRWAFSKLIGVWCWQCQSRTCTPSDIPALSLKEHAPPNTSQKKSSFHHTSIHSHWYHWGYDFWQCLLVNCQRDENIEKCIGKYQLSSLILKVYDTSYWLRKIGNEKCGWLIIVGGAPVKSREK